MIQWKQNISREIFEMKYMLQGEKDPDEVFRLIAREIASSEPEGSRGEWEQRFYDQISTGRIIPAGRILANARPNSPIKNYNNCFTIDIEDSMESIYDSLKEDALISKMGGGVGFDISRLRPAGEKLSRGGESSGVVSFLRIFDQSAKTIMTGGQRRSAHIALLDISHPEIERFITAKQGDGNKELTQFNISVKITDAFMKAVREDLKWDLVFGGNVYKTVKARDLYDLLARNAFLHNEPGIFCSDTVERFNNGWWAFKMDRVNPCGELVMPPYSLCCLSAVNLAMFVDKPFTAEARFDREAYRESIRTGVRFLDNVLNVTAYPLEKIKTFSLQWRRIGLGITGLGDLFAMLGLNYGDKESITLAGEVCRILRDVSYETSADLAAEKGAFPAFDAEKLLKAEFVKTLPATIREKIGHQGLRNIQMNTIAPTGTTSLSVGQNCSSGIEPIFSLAYNRKIRTGKGDETRSEEVCDYAWLLWKEAHPGSSSVPDCFVTTRDIDPYRSIDVQAACQQYIDHSISKTLNLPPKTSFEQYKELFAYAYDKGLKGFTTFNPEGSMKGILEYQEQTIRPATAPTRPRNLPCDIHRISHNKKSFIVILGFLHGSLYELFVMDETDKPINLGEKDHGIIRKVERGRYDLVYKNGKETTILENFTRTFDSPVSALARFISMALRHGTPVPYVVDQLTKDTNFSDFERTVSRVLKKYIRDGEEVISGGGECPECGVKLVYRDGCITCMECGYSKCV
jgi:ribonucleoside-diphosphate reductase alpha chain